MRRGEREDTGGGGAGGEASILRHSRRLGSVALLARGIVCPPILLLCWGGRTDVGLTATTTIEPASGITVGGKGGRGRTGKDADVKDVDVKADGEGISLPLILPRRIIRRRSYQRKLWSGRPQPLMRLRPIPKENLKRQKPISHGGTGIK